MEFDNQVCAFPCGRRPGEFCHVPIKPPNDRGWEWDGNVDKPTLSPSIRCLVNGCTLHIFVRAGEVVHT